MDFYFTQHVYYIYAYLWRFTLYVSAIEQKVLDQRFPNFFGPPPPLVPYTHPQRPPTFFKKHKCAFVSTFILYLKNRLNKIIIVKLNILSVN
jgi:hypothetical protein